MCPCVALALVCYLSADGDPLTAAHRHLARGRYTEAAEAFDELLKDQPHNEAAILGRVEAHRIQGERDEAEELLNAAIKGRPTSAKLLAAKAKLCFERGRIHEAGDLAREVLQTHPEQPLARLIQAHVWAEQGQLKDASEGYRWFVRYYNRVQPTDAETLLLVAEGASYYARWHSVAQIFDFTVNTLCTDALKSDPNCWQAHAIAGALLLEKHNRGEALPELQAALAINPHAVPVHLSLASAAMEQLQYEQARQHIERALAVDSAQPVALRLLAELEMTQGRLDTAAQLIERSLKAQRDNQLTLALAAFLRTFANEQPSADRLQQLFAHLDHIQDWQAADSQFEQIVVQLARRNPRPGYFLNELGRLFESQRKFALAERCYQQAIVSMPQLSQPKTELGMLYFQTGRMAEAQQLLDEAFKSDPYQVRVSNMRKVLKVLNGYATVTTPHFVIRADSQLDGVLAKYMADYLEEIYPEVTQRFGYEPPQRTQIEIYNKTQGLGGHQWFSARMVGLPWLQTIGASTGTIVAMTSPSATDEPFNWARVLRHEFVHIVTLQQTDFNIPHWLTEALATREEGYPPPPQWNTLLRDRVAKNQLRNLDNLHLGFQRAESRDDWNFAYCQSVLYAEYFVDRFGADALPRLLNAYRDTRSTDEALRRAYDVSKADVEQGYLVFLKQRVEQLQSTTGEAPRDAAEIRQAYESNPDNPDVQADYAALQLRLGKLDVAARLAEGVIARDAQHAAAAVVLAQTKLKAGDVEAAAQVISRAYNAQRPHAELWWLVGQIWLKQDQAHQALKLFQEGRAAFPNDRRWLRGLADAAEAARQPEALEAALEIIAATDADDAGPRIKLAEMAYERGDFARAAKYARLALHIDVLDAEVHVLLARAFRALKQLPGALNEYGVALKLQPGQADWDVEYSDTLWDAGHKDDAQQRLNGVLKKYPQHAAALRLRQRWHE